MTMFGKAKAAVEIDGRAFKAGFDRAYERVLIAAKDSVKAEARALEQRVESATRTVRRGNLWRAWKSAVYPKVGLAKEPVGEVFIGRSGPRSRGAAQALLGGAVIRGTRGQMLAIPIRNSRASTIALRRGRYSETLTPALWERRTGLKLKALPRPGKNTLLVIDRRRSRVGAFRNEAPESAADFTPVFVLVPIAVQPRALNLDDMTRGSAANLARRMQAKIRLIATQSNRGAA